MRLVSWDYYCDACDSRTIELMERDSVPDHIVCSGCEGQMDRIYGAVQSRTEKTSKTRVDGKGFKGSKDLAKAYRLESKAYDQPQGSQERQGLLNEAESYRKIRK